MIGTFTVQDNPSTLNPLRCTVMSLLSSDVTSTSASSSETLAGLMVDLDGHCAPSFFLRVHSFIFSAMFSFHIYV
jgi:hypothetical protein